MKARMAQIRPEIWKLRLRIVVAATFVEYARQDGCEIVTIWDAKTVSIIVKQDQLKNRRRYAGTLLHEVSHALSGAGDVTADFEMQLTSLLGLIADKAVTD
jgi:hypothetical protein